MSVNSVTVVGSVALDTIEAPEGKVGEVLGGSALYFGAAGTLFAPVHIVGVVGDDFPEEKFQTLVAKGVNVNCVEKVPGKTFRWHGRYYQDINRRETLSLDLGVFANFVPRLSPSASQAKALMLANIDPQLQADVLEQMTQPTFVAYDTMNHWIEERRREVEQMVKKVDIVFLNEEELFLLMQNTNLVKSANRLLELGPRYVVVKRGAYGACLFIKDKVPFLCPAFPLDRPIDPTGAGDSFAGGLLGYLVATGEITDYNLRRAVVYGTIVASFTVEGFGLSRLERLTIDEVEERFRKFQSMVEF
ncbi:MAG: PfkB family carbohydrate kinase [bacterium]